MNCTEIKNEGLSRTFSVNIPAADLMRRLDARIAEIRPQMNLKGFRPGKVPVAHVRKMFGKSIMGELIETVVGEATQRAIDEANIRPATQPSVHFESDMDGVLAGTTDLAYHFHIEAMPEFEPVDVSTLKVTRPVCPVSDEAVSEALGKIAAQNKTYEPRAKTAKAVDGDAVVIDFVGKIDGEAFEGGSAEESTVVIGAGRFIPGFEEQLIGVKTGQETEINVTFPADYGAAHLAGKAAVFEIKVREVRKPVEPTLDDDFAKGLGLESLEKLNEIVRQQLEGEHARASRLKAKRSLLDALDTAHSFELPGRMVEAEFDQIWSQLEQEKAAGRLDAEDAAKDEEQLRADYQRISQRRVRLGLVLAEIGQRAGVQITDEETQRAMIAEARQYPGQERQVLQYFQKNPGALAQLRAPIYEDKVVDLLLTRVQLIEQTVDRETLLSDDDME